MVFTVCVCLCLFACVHTYVCVLCVSVGMDVSFDVNVYVVVIHVIVRSPAIFFSLGWMWGGIEGFEGDGMCSRGEDSFGMVMCASTSDKSAVQPLAPPKECNPGDRITVDGCDGQPDKVLSTKKMQRILQVWETVCACSRWGHLSCDHTFP